MPVKPRPKILHLTVLVNCFLFFNKAGAQVHPDSLIDIAFSIQYIYPDSALKMMDSLEIHHNEQLTDEQLCDVFRAKGNVYWFQSKLHTSIRYYRKALALGIKNQDSNEIIKCQGEIGYVYSDLGLNDSAIFYLRSSINLADEVNDSVAKHRSLDYLAHCYDNNKDYRKAIDTYQSILPFFHKNESRRNLLVIYTNMGGSYHRMGEVDTAIYYYEYVLSKADSTGESDLIATVKLNISYVYGEKGDFDKALTSVYESRRIFERIGSVTGEVSTKIAEAALYYQNEQYHTSIELFKNVLVELEEMGDLIRQVSTIEKLALAQEKAHNYQDAYQSLVLLREMEDSLKSFQDEQFLQDMNAKYQSEQQEKQIALLNKDKALKDALLGQQDAEIERANLQKLLFGIGLSLVLVLAILIFLGLRQKQKANKILSDQKAQIEEKNKEIVDSITYAKRIQNAILPPEKLVNNLLPNSFILYLPKDIVAGDFYWMEQKDNKTLLAAADCTGHGVPGAMVSVICNNGLNRSVREFGLTQPSEILDKTRELVIAEFEKSEEEVKDGMDIALISMEEQADQTYKIEFSGANNPLWVLRHAAEDIEEIKGDKQPIGKHAEEKDFSHNEITLKKGDTCYLFSDGFADQFGGDKGKKFKTSNLKKLLLSIQDQSIEDQKETLHQEFVKWQGNYEQLDDICFIGLRI